jgi:hypothetical protein
MERLYKGFEIIKNHFHTSSQQQALQALLNRGMKFPN